MDRCSSCEGQALAGCEEIIDINLCLSEDGAKRPFGHVSGVTRHGNLPAGLPVAPDFMAPWTRAIEHVTESSQPADYLPVPEPRQPSH